MPLDIIIGAQWGDEGKGRITDLLAERAQVVARYSGGDNAGHTVTVGRQIFKLHLLPCGVVHPGTVGVLGNGMVVNPARLLEEMERLAQLGLDVSPERIKTSGAAHLITPAHVALDRADEASRSDTGDRIGTTGRGIGPAYTDKNARRGLRAELLLDPEHLGDRVAEHVRRANVTLEKLYGQLPLDPAAVAADVGRRVQRAGPRPQIREPPRRRDEGISNAGGRGAVSHRSLRRGGRALAGYGREPVGRVRHDDRPPAPLRLARPRPAPVRSPRQRPHRARADEAG